MVFSGHQTVSPVILVHLKKSSDWFSALFGKAAAADAVVQGCAEQLTCITEPTWLPLSIQLAAF